jgi:hypothetical protein
MSDLSSVTRVQRDGDQLVAECTCCDLQLTQIPAFDPDIALGMLLQHHPASPEAVHRPTVPPGWS